MSDNLAFYGTSADTEYLAALKTCVSGATTFVKLDKVTTLLEVVLYCSERNVTGIISTSIPLLSKLLNWNKTKAPALSNYAGSLFRIPVKSTNSYIECLFVEPLKQTITVPYGRFLLKRHVDKLTRKDMWFPEIKFNWNILYPDNAEEAFNKLSSAFLIAIDIETFKNKAQIRCIAFCGFWYSKSGDGSIVSHSYVLPLDSEFNLLWMRRFCWELRAPKVFQNGKYDINYLLRYNAPVYNYLYDTANMFHCWYSELPKDLASLNAFFIREAIYWKDLAETDDLHEYYRYNALDTWTTGVSLLAMITEMPKFAFDNYLLEFPVVFPCILAEMTGVKRDVARLESARASKQAEDGKTVASLRNILSAPSFNPGSSQQVVKLLTILGCKDIDSSDEKALTKARFRHPFNGRILGYVATSRKARKLLTTYLTTGEDAKEFKGRILYALNPHGTDSSRLASKEHHP